jgi:hypothetical protein
LWLNIGSLAVMKKRNPLAVFGLSLITCGIYACFWYYYTKEEMVKAGAEIPTFILAFIPIINLYWLWKWAKGVEKVTQNAWGAVPCFICVILLGPIGMAITQAQFNKIATA